MQGLLDLACSGKGKAYHFVLATCSAEDLHRRMTTAWGHQSSGEVFHAAAFVLGPASSPCYMDTGTVPAWASCQALCKHCHTGYTFPAAGCHTACYTYPLRGVWLEAHTCHPCVSCSSAAVDTFQVDVLHMVAVLREVLVLDTAAHTVHASCHSHFHKRIAVAGSCSCWTLLQMDSGYTYLVFHY